MDRAHAAPGMGTTGEGERRGMTRAAILTRVSDASQAGADRHSLSYQREIMEAWAARMGWEIVRIFEIPGESAFKWRITERPQFQMAIDAASRREFEVLIIYDLSRFARNQTVLHETRRTLMEAGVRLMVAVGEFDAVEDGMLAGIHGMVAEQYSKDHSRKVQAAYARRHALGLPTGDMPFGYISGPDGRTPVIVPDEAEAIRWAFGQYIVGIGYQALAGEFNRRGLHPRSKRGLLAFTPSSIQSIIENRFYAGVVTHKGHEGPGAHEAIITDEQWQRASDSTRRHGRQVRSTYAALLQGLTQCAHCAGPIWSNRSGPAMRAYYWEPSARRGRTCMASGRKWRADDVDARVEEDILGMAFDQRFFEWAAVRAARTEGVVDARLERSRIEAKRSRAVEAYVDGRLAEPAYRRMMSEADAQLAALASVVDTGVISIGERFTSMVEAWGIATPEDRNELARILFDAVRIDVVGHEVWVRPAPEFAPLLDARRDYVMREGTGTPDRTRTISVPSWFHTSELVA